MEITSDRLQCSVAIEVRFNTLRPRQDGRHFPDDIFKWIFLNENVQICLRFHWNLFPRFRINKIPPLVQIMAWCQLGDKPLSETMTVSLLTHIIYASLSLGLNELTLVLLGWIHYSEVPNKHPVSTINFGLSFHPVWKLFRTVLQLILLIQTCLLLETLLYCLTRNVLAWNNWGFLKTIQF